MSKQARLERQSVDTVATTVEQQEPFVIQYLAFLANDGTEDLIVNFDGATDAEGAIRLLPGEVLEDIPLSCASVSFKAASGSTAFRAWGLR